MRPVIGIVIVAAGLHILWLTGTAADTKRWTPNADFDDPGNWDPAHVPSSVDVAVFQENTAVPVVLPAAGVDVCDMVLPVYGQLVMEPNVEIVISASSKNTGGCTGQTVKFKRNTPMEWVDPDNWSNEKVSQATPHVERIPCVHDTVLFNPDNSFSVIVPDVPINIGSMVFGNQTFSQKELNEFLTTDVGDQELRSSSPNNDVSISLTSMVCNDYTGCECGTLQLLDQVCKVVSKRCDNKLGCLSPVEPIGHCCRICGAFFLLNYDPRFFTSHKLNEEFEKDLAKMNLTFQKLQLNIQTGKLLNGKIQIVLASGAKYVDEMDEVAKSVYSILTAYTKRNMGITDVNMFNSGLSYDVDAMTYGQLALTTCTIIISCLLAIIFYYTKDWKSLLSGSRSSAGAVFVKFENDTNDVELINEDNRPQRKSSFNNPTYGAVENLTRSQTFSEALSYTATAADQSASMTTDGNGATDVELKETDKQK